MLGGRISTGGFASRPDGLLWRTVSGARLDGDRGRAALFVLQMEELAVEPI